MKKVFVPSRHLAGLMLIALATLSSVAKAQKAPVEFEKITVSSGARLIGYNEMPFTKVLLSCNVDAHINVAELEVECSFDLVNFSSIGKARQTASTDRSSKLFEFEDNSWILSRQPKAQYRIKVVDSEGTVSYSEPMMVGLKS